MYSTLCLESDVSYCTLHLKTRVRSFFLYTLSKQESGDSSCSVCQEKSHEFLSWHFAQGKSQELLCVHHGGINGVHSHVDLGHRVRSVHSVYTVLGSQNPFCALLLDLGHSICSVRVYCNVLYNQNNNIAHYLKQYCMYSIVQHGHVMACNVRRWTRSICHVPCLILNALRCNVNI